LPIRFGELGNVIRELIAREFPEHAGLSRSSFAE
jgi:hypothetical protein